MERRRAGREHPYEGRRAALATKHGKERQIARPFSVALGLDVCVPQNIDTDLLGTFTGEIPRPGTVRQVVLQKAHMGMQMSELPLGLANEGSFGPHPASPMLLADTEFLIFVDEEREIQVLETLVSEQVVAEQCTASSIDELTPFLARVQFPTHGLIIRPHGPLAVVAPEQIVKGITDAETLARTIKRSADVAPDHLALVETDLRAHMNPTRQRVILRLAIRLARRLTQLCSSCGTPGWGIVDMVTGLPCEWCGGATELVREEVMGCPSCTHRELVPRSDGLRHAPPGQCPHCNP